MRRLALLISCFLLLLSTSVVRAELGASPMVLSLEAQPGTIVKTVVNTFVTSPEDSHIDVRLEDLQDQRLMNSPWRVAKPALAEEAHDSPNSCQDWISVESSGILHPDQDGRIAIPVSINVPKDANSLYYAALVIRETSLKEGALVVRGELVVSIFVRAKGAFSPFDIDIKGIASIKDLSKTAATLSVPSSVTLYQQSGSNNYAGSGFACELATNFSAKVSALISPTEAALAELSTDTPPSHDGGRTQFDLKVIANNVNLLALTAGSRGVTLGDLTIQIIPDFTMFYDAKCIPPFDAHSDAKQWMTAIAAQVNQETRKIEELDQILHRVREDIQRQRQWLRGEHKSENVSIEKLDGNEQNIEQALYQTRMIRGSLANAKLWMEMASIPCDEDTFIQHWLQQEALPWVQTFLGQLQQWQQNCEVINWCHQLEQVAFLPIEDSLLIRESLHPMPSQTSLTMMPILPQGRAIDRNESAEEIFLPGQRHWCNLPIRNLADELRRDSLQMFIVDPAVEGKVTLCVEDIILEHTLDMICINTGNQWKKGDAFYLVEPRQGGPLSLGYPVEKSMPDSNEPSPGEFCWYWENTRLDKAVSDLAFEAKANLVLEAGLDPEQRVALTCEDCSLEGVLNKLCRTIGCTWKKTPYFYWILPVSDSEDLH